MLGSSNRANPFAYPVKIPDGRVEIHDVSKRCMANLAKLDLHGLIVVGGDGTMSFSQKFIENGATRIIPGTHLRDHSPVFGQPYDSIAAVMPKGSVMVYDGSMWHGGGANRTGQRRIGVAISGQSDDLAPADGALYALRDATGTVESIPLIVSSVVSKKTASGAAAVVFDVKCGAGAFTRTREEARSLARELMDVTRAMGRNARAFVTSMDQPLGSAIGNANETAEAIEVLHQRAPADLTLLTRTLGAAMLVAAGVARERHEAEARLDRALELGEAMKCAERFIQAQGGDPRVVTDPSRMARAKTETKVLAPRSGFVSALDGGALGRLLVSMGGGRRTKEDSVDASVGIRLLRKVGDPVTAGEPVALIEAHRDAPDWAAAAASAYAFGEARVEPPALVLDDLTK